MTFANRQTEWLEVEDTGGEVQSFAAFLANHHPYRGSGREYCTCLGWSSDDEVKWEIHVARVYWGRTA